MFESNMRTFAAPWVNLPTLIFQAADGLSAAY